MEAAFTIVWNVLKEGFPLIKRQFGYVTSSESLAADLQEEVGNLENEAERVRVLETEARNNVRNVRDDFTTWKANVDNASREARDLLDAFDKATKTCCYGTLPDLKCRYRFSKDAEDKIESIKKLAGKGGEFKEPKDIISIGSAPGQVTFSNPAMTVQSPTATTPASSASTSVEPKDHGIFDSRASMIRKIKDALDDNSNSVVGVHGMGGVGKSTLLDQGKDILSKESVFDWVAKADVSQKPDVKRIQEEIAHWLGLTDMKKEDNVNVRADLLRKRLEYEEREKKKVLIILDNLWDKVDLKSVGIPCGHDNKVKGCKLLLTSRDLTILQTEMGCDRDFFLDGLQGEEARALFETIVGDKVHTDEFKPWVEKALRRCAGVPFLIVALAKRFKNAELFQWRDALRNMEQFKDKNINESIDHVLRWSYDNLEEEAKALLRLCVVCSVSKPSLEHLVRYGFGLGLFREVSSVDEARDRLHTLIRALQDSALLLDSEDDGGFKIHDLVHDFVASVSSTDHPLLVLDDQVKSVMELQEDKLKSCEAMCLPDVKELPQELCCPELRIFLLLHNYRYGAEYAEVPDSYFNSMRKLAVLSLTRIRLTRSLTPFQSLVNLHTLYLRSCSLKDVAILGKLKGLQILRIVGSNIQRLPKEIGQLVELRLLDLSDCSPLEIIEPGVLENLTRLEELYMGREFQKWSAGEHTPPTNASLIELNNMKNLRTLHVSISNLSVLPKDLNFEQLTKYDIIIGYEGRQYVGEPNRSTTLQLLNTTSDFLREGCIQSILHKAEELFLDKFNGSEQSIYGLSLEGFPQLKNLRVADSPSIRYVLESSFLPASKALEMLFLENLINLEKITNNNISTESFSTLKVVRVHSCGKMKVLFPRSVVRELAQLEKIEVVDCKLMQGIVEADDDRDKLEFPKLRVLELRDLPNIENFIITGSAHSSGTSDGQVGTQSAFFSGQQVAFPSLEELYIEGMSNIEMIWDDQVAMDSFSKLNSLHVDKCNKFVNIVPSIVLGQLLSLERLKAQSFDSLKVVFKFRPLNPLDGHSVARSPLKELKLFNLPELKCIWDKEGLEEQSIDVEAVEGTSHELKVILPFASYFQHLKTLEVSYCDGLSNLFAPTMATNLVGLTKLKISKCGLLTEVISDEGGREGHVVAFNQLKYIELDGLIGLRCFYSGGYTLKMPLLEEVIVTECLEMKFFSGGPIEASKLERVQASKEAWFWKENLNITVQHMFEEMGTATGIKNMLLSEFPELIGKWHSELNPIKSSWQLKSLTVDKCPSFINAIPSRLMLVLENMERLQVRDCESLEEIFDLEGLENVESTRVLPSFRTLDLVNLPKLRRLWNKDLQGSLSFDYLNSVTIYKCSSLTHAFVPSMARCLANLKRMEIKECGQMEAVIAEEEGQGSVVEKILFQKLKWLNLERLPNLTSFLLGKNHMLECPELEELTITHCPQMRNLAWQSLMEIDNGIPSLFTPQVQFPRLKQVFLSHMDNLSKIWTDDPQETLTFDYLEEVEVQNCVSLENLSPYWVATSLNQLKKIRVESCRIEEIVANGDDAPHSTIAPVLLPKLTSLVLHDMPRLKTFCPNLATFNWPLLKKLRVTHCDKVNIPSFVASMNKWTQKNNQQDLLDQEAHSSFERDFPNLEKLLLVENDIQIIEDGKFPGDIFGQTEAITLACFHEEKAIFPTKFLLERFQNLKNLEVFCGSFEDIFLDEGIVDDGKHPVLESLRKLKLSKLHKLKRVWREDYLVSKILKSIKILEVSDCASLTTLFPAVTSFQNLTMLVVTNSSGLVHLATASAVTNMVHLWIMIIIGCERMKEVVENDENGEGKMISFWNLRRLRLQNMPSLECFTSCILKFPSLMNIEVIECPKMKIFSKGTLSTPRLNWGTMFRYNWNEEWNGDLNRAIRKLSA